MLPAVVSLTASSSSGSGQGSARPMTEQDDRRRRPTHLPRWPWPGVVAIALAAAIASCGGGGGSGSSSTATSTAQAPAGGLQSRFVDVVNRVAPQVVQIETDRGLGSGIVFDGHGDIVTNAHVVASAKEFRVTAANGKRFSATLVGTFAPDDLAVVRAKGADLKPASFGRSSQLEVGDIVLAIGNPLGLRSSVTEGIVSALGRTVSEPGGATLPSVIQTSAPINPGNSGGALVDLDGKVVGIPTLAATDPELGGSAAPGIGFAIPSDTVRDIASQLVDQGKVVDSHRAYLGVRLAASMGSPAAVVASVDAGGPAAKAGMKPGDVILSLESRHMTGPQDVASVLASSKPGDTVSVQIRSAAGGTSKTLHVRLGTYPGGG